MLEGLSLIISIVSLILVILSLIYTNHRKKISSLRNIVPIESEEEKFALLNYREPFCIIPSTKRKVKLLRYFQNCIANVDPSAKKIYNLIGIPGVGKTSFFVKIESIKEDLRFSVKRIKLSEIDVKSLVQMPEVTNTILLIDAVEETSIDEIKDFYGKKLNQLQLFARIIIALREETLERAQIYIKEFNDDRPPRYRIENIQIQVFSNLQLVKYLIKVFYPHYNKLYYNINLLRKYWELFKTPFFANNLISISSDKPKDDTIISMYELIINSKINDLHVISENFNIDQITTLYQEIAYALLKENNNTNSISINKLSKEYQKHIKSLPFLRIENQIVRFSHFSFYEYYLAQYLIRNHKKSSISTRLPNTQLFSQFLQENVLISFLNSCEGRFVINEDIYYSHQNFKKINSELINKITSVYLRISDNNIYNIIPYLQFLKKLKTIFISDSRGSLSLYKFLISLNDINLQNESIKALDTLSEELINISYRLSKKWKGMLPEYKGYYNIQAEKHDSLIIHYGCEIFNLLMSKKIIQLDGTINNKINIDNKDISAIRSFLEKYSQLDKFFGSRVAIRLV